MHSLVLGRLEAMPQGASIAERQEASEASLAGLLHLASPAAQPLLSLLLRMHLNEQVQHIWNPACSFSRRANTTSCSVEYDSILSFIMAACAGVPSSTKARPGKLRRVQGCGEGAAKQHGGAVATGRGTSCRPDHRGGENLYLSSKQLKRLCTVMNSLQLQG